MDDDKNREPGERLRSILSNNAASNEQPDQQSQADGVSPLAKLPKLNKAAQETRKPPQTTPKPATVNMGLKLKFGLPFWTVTLILSLIANCIMIALLITSLRMLGALRGAAGDVGAGLIGGLYSNFEKMDRSHITTNILITTEIPVTFDIEINTQTDVVLTQDVNIRVP
ncbi:MAG: hypothetical protein QGD96_10880 [Anaerolineae bacterium]|nr:hypothetical protein [Anaerolineae bacterium]